MLANGAFIILGAFACFICGIMVGAWLAGDAE